MRTWLYKNWLLTLALIESALALFYLAMAFYLRIGDGLVYWLIYPARTMYWVTPLTFIGWLLLLLSNANELLHPTIQDYYSPHLRLALLLIFCSWLVMGLASIGYAWSDIDPHDSLRVGDHVYNLAYAYTYSYESLPDRFYIFDCRLYQLHCHQLAEIVPVYSGIAREDRLGTLKFDPAKDTLAVLQQGHVIYELSLSAQGQ